MYNKLIDNDELNLFEKWADFSKKNGTFLYICRSAAVRRGIIDFQKKSQIHAVRDISSVFQVSGLSSILERLLSCDRFIQF